MFLPCSRAVEAEPWAGAWTRAQGRARDGLETLF